MRSEIIQSEAASTVQEVEEGLRSWIFEILTFCV